MVCAVHSLLALYSSPSLGVNYTNACPVLRRYCSSVALETRYELPETSSITDREVYQYVQQKHTQDVLPVSETGFPLLCSLTTLPDCSH